MLAELRDYSAPDRGAKYCDERVCLSVCLSAIVSSGLHVQSSSDFLCMLPMAEARSSSGGVLFCSLAVLDPRVGHTTDVLSPFIPVLCHSD